MRNASNVRTSLLERLPSPPILLSISTLLCPWLVNSSGAHRQSKCRPTKTLHVRYQVRENLRYGAGPPGRAGTVWWHSHSLTFKVPAFTNGTAAEMAKPFLSSVLLMTGARHSRPSTADVLVAMSSCTVKKNKKTRLAHVPCSQSTFSFNSYGVLKCLNC